MLRSVLAASRRSLTARRPLPSLLARTMADSKPIPKLSEVGPGPTATTAVNEAPEGPKAETSKSAGTPASQARAAPADLASLQPRKQRKKLSELLSKPSSRRPSLMGCAGLQVFGATQTSDNFSALQAKPEGGAPAQPKKKKPAKEEDPPFVSTTKPGEKKGAYELLLSQLSQTS